MSAAAAALSVRLLSCFTVLSVVSSAAAIGHSGCAWQSCRHVILESPSDDSRSSLKPNSVLTVHRCELDGSSSPSYALTAHDGCRLPTAAEGRVSNFSMTRAGLRRPPLRDLCRFANLTSVDLSENAIAEFIYPLEPRLQQDCLRRLRSLSLRGNKLVQLDITQLLYLESLEVMDVSENSLLEAIFVTHLPNPRRSRLKTLNAARCRVKQVDVSLVRLASLQEVNLSHNQVTLLTNRLRWRWTLDDIRAVEREREIRRSTDASYYLRLTVRLTHNQLGPEAFGLRRLWGLPVPPLDGAPDAVVARLKLYRDAFQPFLHVDNRGSTLACDCRALHAWRYFKSAAAASGSADSRISGGRPSAGLFARRNALAIDAWLDLPCERSGGGGVDKTPPTLLSLQGDELRCDHRIDCPSGCLCFELVADSSLTVDCTETASLTALPRRLPVGVHRVRYRLRLSGNRIADITDPDAPARAGQVDELDLSRNRLGPASHLIGLRHFTSLRLLNLTDSGLVDLPDALLDAGADRGVRIELGDAELACHCDLFEPTRWSRILAALPDEHRRLRCRRLSLLEFQHQNCPPTSAASTASAAAAAGAENSTNSIIILRDRRPRNGGGSAVGGGEGGGRSPGNGDSRNDLVGASVLLVVGVASGAVVVALAVATVAVAVANSRRFAEFFFLRGGGGGGGQSGGAARRIAAATAANGAAVSTHSASSGAAATGVASATSTSCNSATSCSGAGCYPRKSPLLMPAAPSVCGSAERQPLFSSTRCCGIPPDLVPPPSCTMGIGGSPNPHSSSPYDLPRYVCSADFAAPVASAAGFHDNSANDDNDEIYDPDRDESNIDDEASGVAGFEPDRIRRPELLVGNRRLVTTLPLPVRRRVLLAKKQQQQQQRHQRRSSGSGLDSVLGACRSQSYSAQPQQFPPPLPPRPQHQSLSISPSMAKLLETIEFPIAMETDV